MEIFSRIYSPEHFSVVMTPGKSGVITHFLSAFYVRSWEETKLKCRISLGYLMGTSDVCHPPLFTGKLIIEERAVILTEAKFTTVIIHENHNVIGKFH